jgi:hypothetical protein
MHGEIEEEKGMLTAVKNELRDEQRRREARDGRWRSSARFGEVVKPTQDEKQREKGLDGFLMAQRRPKRIETRRRSTVVAPANTALRFCEGERGN